MHPVLFKSSGANVENWIKVLDSVGKMQISTVIPGHGAIGKIDQILSLKEYFLSIYSSIDNEKMMSDLMQKYKKYTSIQTMSGFDKTVTFIKDEIADAQK